MSEDQSSQFDERRGYEIQRALNEIVRLSKDTEWIPDKLLRLVASVCPTAKDFTEVRNFVIYEDDAQTIRREYYDPSFRVKFIEEIWGQVNKSLLSLDPMTRVFAMGAYSGEIQRVYPFDDFSPKFFTKPLGSPGSFGTITGPIKKPLGVGKTDYAGLEMEMLLTSGQRVATNILIDDMPVGMTQIWGMKDMMRLAIENSFKGTMTTAILDEFTQFISKEKGTANVWVNFKKFLYLCRKINLNIIAVSQREGEIPTAVQEMAVWHVQKQDKTVMDYRHFTDITRVVGVPGTTLKFKTGHPGSFEPGDLNIGGMHDHIVACEREARDLGTHADVLRAIMEFLDMDSSKISKTDLKSFAKVAFVNGGMTQKEIAEFCVLDDKPVSQQTISNWLKEMGVC